MSSSTPFGTPLRRPPNLPTAHFGQASPRATGTAAPSPPAAPDLDVLYRFAAATERARTKMPVPGFRLYWITEGAFGSFDVEARPSSALIIGRHTQCDVMLDRDDRVSLRHLLVRCTLLDDGCPMLSVLDLKSSLGFGLARATTEPQSSIAGVGPLTLSIGSYGLVCLPQGEPIPDSMPQASCAPSAEHPYRASGRQLGTSQIAILPSPVELAEGASPSSRRAGLEMFQITLASPRGVAHAVVSGEELDRGLLFGRAPRCVGSVQNVLGNGISRVHLALVRTKGALRAFDVASVQGTYDASGRRIRSMPIGDDGALLYLGADAQRVMLRIVPV